MNDLNYDGHHWWWTILKPTHFKISPYLFRRSMSFWCPGASTEDWDDEEGYYVAQARHGATWGDMARQNIPNASPFCFSFFPFSLFSPLFSFFFPFFPFFPLFSIFPMLWVVEIGVCQVCQVCHGTSFTAVLMDLRKPRYCTCTCEDERHYPWSLWMFGPNLG